MNPNPQPFAPPPDDGAALSILETLAARLPGLGHDRLATPVAGLLLRCGGTPKRARFAVYRGPCRATVIAAFPIADMATFNAGLESIGWALAIGRSAASAGEPVVDERGLNIPGQSFADVLCPACAQELVKRLSLESGR